MFENIINFFKKLIKNDKTNSKDTAKERLHLVLAQDRANISVDFLEMMKQEIIEVIKKYIEVDEKAIDVRLTNKVVEDGTNSAPSLYANIPIITIKNEARKLQGEKEKEDKEEKIEENKTEKEEEKEDIDKNEEQQKEETKNDVIEEDKKEDNKEETDNEKKEEAKENKGEEIEKIEESEEENIDKKEQVEVKEEKKENLPETKNSDEGNNE